jgi:hypothetical protein
VKLRFEDDVLDLQVLDGLKVDGDVGRIDAGQVETDGEVSTLSKLNFPEKEICLIEVGLQTKVRISQNQILCGVQ